jgi:hypothetical protein
MIEMSTVSRGDVAQDSDRRGRLEELIERACSVSTAHDITGSLGPSIADGGGSRFGTFSGKASNTV